VALAVVSGSPAAVLGDLGGGHPTTRRSVRTEARAAGSRRHP